MEACRASPTPSSSRIARLHRNEIYWDQSDMSDARYPLRRRWTDVEQAILKFPEHADLLRMTMGRWVDRMDLDHGRSSSTGLAMNMLDERLEHRGTAVARPRDRPRVPLRAVVSPLGECDRAQEQGRPRRGVRQDQPGARCCWPWAP